MATDWKHSILLAGIGGDSHSVGLTILRQALRAGGYYVHFLGPQNRLEEIFQVALFFNAVMISSVDGHARHYLRDFPELTRRCGARGPLWYLGGNLTIADPLGCERYFREMGFDRVFVKFVDLREVLEIIGADLNTQKPVGGSAPVLVSNKRAVLASTAVASDDKLDRSVFHDARREVLQGWRTGWQARDMKGNAEFLARQPSVAQLQMLVSEPCKRPLIQPRCGVALAGPQLRMFTLLKAAGASVLSYQVDSLTRNNNYIGAEEAIRENEALDSSTLNGFPVVNHGVPALRRISTELQIPLQVRHSTRDPRLLAEVSYAGGVTSFEGGAICYNIPYYKDYPLDESIRNWQYVDYLTGCYYREYGIVLDREFFGTLTATLIPPCLAIAVGILQAILAAEQGVRSVSLGYAEGGNRSQDVAAVRMLRCLTADMLGNLGYDNVEVSTVFHQYMAAFPRDERRAEELIFNSAATAQLAGATRLIIKTAVEASRIPSLEDNAHAIDIVRRGTIAADKESVDEATVSRECDVIRDEVDAIVNNIIGCGAGSVAQGIVVGFARGYLDIPFAPSIYNRGAVVTGRDLDGAIRFLSIGNLPFDRALCEFHRDRMDSRMRAGGWFTEAHEPMLVEHDVLQIPRGEYDRWPLG